MVNGKAKGSAFERALANTLSKRFAEATGLTNSFRRNVDSGSFFGGTNARRIATHDTESACFGDIQTPRNFRFNIECKAYATPPSLGQLAKGSCPILDKWLAQAEADASNAGKVPALIIKWNHTPVLVLIPQGFDVEPFMMYQGRMVLTLDAWLALPETHFFNEQ